MSDTRACQMEKALEAYLPAAAIVSLNGRARSSAPEHRPRRQRACPESTSRHRSVPGTSPRPKLSGRRGRLLRCASSGRRPSTVQHLQAARKGATQLGGQRAPVLVCQGAAPALCRAAFERRNTHGETWQPCSAAQQCVCTLARSSFRTRHQVCTGAMPNDPSASAAIGRGGPRSEVV